MTINIVGYDGIDPVDALQLSLLALDFPLTPEHAAHLRRTDPRPFPCLALYAVENGMALGQVGVFRLPMISTAGPEDVGGLWAVAAHPEHAGRGLISQLIEEAHATMVSAGLRFSTLATDRYRGAYRLYQRHGYVDMQVTGTALACWETAHQPTRLHAQPLGPEGFVFVEQLFAEIARDQLGFAWRHSPFVRLSDKVAPGDVKIIFRNNIPVGYALAHHDGSFLKVSNLLLADEASAAEAVSALVAERRPAYVAVSVSRPRDVDSLRRAGYQVAHPDWSAFMVKSLLPSGSAEEARRLFGIGTDRFLISWLDTT